MNPIVRVCGPAVFSAAFALCGAEIAAGSQTPSVSREGQPHKAGAIAVEIVRNGAEYTLLRGGKPYRIKGAGLDIKDMASFAAHGGNSMRTWRTDDAQQLLDAAARYGITVILCIEIGRERLGFDYDDARAVQQQFEYARGEVLKYKDHPALLAWMISNEPDMKFTNPRVFDAINAISRMIHEIDGKHPTTTALSGLNGELVKLIDQRAADLDFISVQTYGGIFSLAGRIAETPFRRPYMITEWGTVGFWKPEVEWTAWGAPLEPNSSEKAHHLRSAYQTVIAPSAGKMLGSYVFLWGFKHERTPTWFGMLLADGAETESVDVMHSIWNGVEPENTAPTITGMTLAGKRASQGVVLKSDQSYPAAIAASDRDGDTLDFKWVMMKESEATESGGDEEQVPPRVDGKIRDVDQGSIALTAPQPGAYRLFVTVYDGKGHAGHANIPFLVE